MKIIVFFILLLFNIIFANACTHSELKGQIYANAKTVAKSSGLYIGFLVKEDNKISIFDLIKVNDGHNNITVSNLKASAFYKIQKLESALSGEVKIIFPDNAMFASSVDANINKDIQILSSITVKLSAENNNSSQDVVLFYINIASIPDEPNN